MKAIITGSTGMIGKGLLLESIDDKRIKKILLINRNAIGITHPKVTEIIHNDFSDFTSITDKLRAYDVCYHCMGISAAGLNEEKYTEITFNFTKALATTLFSLNPEIVFNYVSGTGTDSSEKGRVMWARVKGKTENLILNMGFKDAYAFRPGAILPERGIKSRTAMYNMAYFILRPIFPLMKKMKSVTTTTQLAKAMINIYYNPQKLKHLNSAEINRIAKDI